MAKENNLVMWAILGILAFAVFNGQTPATTTTTGGSIDLCKVVDPSASFTAKRMFLEGTSVTTEYVRVIKDGGDNKDLGQVSLNSGTLGTAPSEKYVLYYSENSSNTTYYGVIEDYTAPCKEAVDNKIATLCQIDATPTLTVFDEYGNIQSGGVTNCQDVSTSDSKDFTVRVRVSADECYGNPDVSKDNAICFWYSTTSIQSVTIAGKTAISAPYVISNAKPAGNGTVCYPLDKLKDNTYVDVPVTIKAVTGQNPGSQNLTVLVKDVDFDLNADDLSLIEGFEDESNNVLGLSADSEIVCVT